MVELHERYHPNDQDEGYPDEDEHVKWRAADKQVTPPTITRHSATCRAFQELLVLRESNQTLQKEINWLQAENLKLRTELTKDAMRKDKEVFLLEWVLMQTIQRYFGLHNSKQIKLPPGNHVLTCQWVWCECGCGVGVDGIVGVDVASAGTGATAP